jgi:hypothetical protein
MGGLSVVIVTPGMNSYYVRELLAFLSLFAGAFLVVLLAVLGLYLLWCFLVMAASWTPQASRSVIAFSRRFIAAYVKA